MAEVCASAVLSRAVLIRRAESRDIDSIITLCWSNVEEGPYKEKIIFDGNKLRMFVGALLADDKARVIVCECEEEIIGAFAFTTFPNYFYFAGKIVASMVVWSVAKRFRGRISMQLLDRAKNEARDLGVQYFVMNGASEKFGALAKHCGFDYLETSYVMELA
jgi:hypothetical protein